MAEFLLVAKIVQGVGAEIITPIAMAIVLDIFPKKRDHMIGIFGMVQFDIPPYR